MKGSYEFDTHDLRAVILRYAKELEMGQKFAENVRLEKTSFSNLIICGMGGSALPAEVLLDYLNQTYPLEIPASICRDYVLPAQASNNSLIFISSYSGNTQETISCLKQAIKLGASIVTFSEGGQVEKIAQENGLAHVKYAIGIPDLQPRYVTTYAFSAMQQVLTNIGLSSKIEKLPLLDARALEIEGEEIAKRIKGKTPVIYASDSFKNLSRIWKIKINENAKTPAFSNYFPELNHNEMIGFCLPQSAFHIIILSSSHDQAQIKKGIEVTKDLLEEKGLTTEMVTIKGENFLEEFLYGMILGDWVAYYLAYEYDQDPSPVLMVEEFKKRMR